MLKTALLTLLAVGIAVVGGAASVWYALDHNDGFDTLRVGVWTAFPDIGTPGSSPYARASVARNGVLALGRAEGLNFVAERDAGGAELARTCTYRIAGNVPTARFWTLYAADRAMKPLPSAASRPSALDSWGAVGLGKAQIDVVVSPHPWPGNWLYVGGKGPMKLMLTLYDTPIASSAEVTSVEMPRLTKIGCDG